MRTCRTCGTQKSLMDFYRHSNGGLDRDCKECRKEYVKANRLARAAQYAAYERSRATLPHRVAARKAYAATPTGRERGNLAKRNFTARYPFKKKASEAVNNAVRDGRIVKAPCEVCGAEKAQAHHDDYTKPLDVRWLCTTHHREWHKHNKPLCPDQAA